MRPQLTVIPGGRNQPEVVAIEKHELDELRMDLTVSLAERFSYASSEHDAWRAVLFAEAKGDLDRIGRIATERLRRSIQERTRATATDPEPEPVVLEASRAA